jgi:hypothetical protein
MGDVSFVVHRRLDFSNTRERTGGGIMERSSIVLVALPILLFGTALAFAADDGVSILDSDL